MRGVGRQHRGTAPTAAGWPTVRKPSTRELALVRRQPSVVSAASSAGALLRRRAPLRPASATTASAPAHRPPRACRVVRRASAPGASATASAASARRPPCGAWRASGRRVRSRPARDDGVRNRRIGRRGLPGRVGASARRASATASTTLRGRASAAASRPRAAPASSGASAAAEACASRGGCRGRPAWPAAPGGAPRAPAGPRSTARRSTSGAARGRTARPAGRCDRHAGAGHPAVAAALRLPPPWRLPDRCSRGHGSTRRSD